MPNIDWREVIIIVALGVTALALSWCTDRDWDPSVDKEAVEKSLRRGRRR